jgi:hypothetical protein
MIRHRHLEHQFVEHVPEVLEPGVLYISMNYSTAVHSCCCGCGEEVVTPFSPTDWRMTFDGETISLWPSIGSWDLACRSHYIIDRGKVIDAGSWTKQRIAAARRTDRTAKAAYYCTIESTSSSAPLQSLSSSSGDTRVFARLKRWLVSLAG